MKIKAAVAPAAGARFQIETVDLDEPREGEILVRIVGVGLCHTDLVARDGLFPFQLPAVLGHEGSGVVERVGSAITKVRPGDKVVLSFRSCGACPRCARGEPAYCHQLPMLNFIGMRPDGSTSVRLDGVPVASNFFAQSSFATYALAYERNVVKVAPDAPIEILGPLGCGVQTGAGGIMRSLACEAGSSVLILGAGAVGLSAVMGAVVQGCGTIIVLEPHEERRKLALGFGATHALDPKAGALPEQVRAILPDGVNYAFDTTGLPAVVEATLLSLAPRGVLGLVGVPPAGAEMFSVATSNLMTFGHAIRGIIEGDSDPDTFIPELVRLNAEGRFPFDKLIKTYPLSAINEAIDDQHHGKCVKVVLLTGQS
jgi:aryl-alcohol dehydrogenase